jgi:hypothetical protein
MYGQSAKANALGKGLQVDRWRAENPFRFREGNSDSIWAIPGMCGRHSLGGS